MTGADLPGLLACAGRAPDGGREGAAVAALLTDDPAQVAQACNLPAAEVAGTVAAAAEWRNTVTPVVSALAGDRPDLCETYVDWLCAVAAAAAAEPAANLDALLFAAAFVNTQQGARPDRVTAGAAPRPCVPAVDVDALAEAFAELDALVGLAAAKAEVRAQAAFHHVQALRAAADLTVADTTRHLVFAGNPGTGKTTVARLVGRIYAAAGLLAGGHLVEVDKSGLVGQYLGQTEARTSEVINAALGGVLFIDEAYALAEDDYGLAAVDVLVKAAEDHRNDLVVVLAGYTEPMQVLLNTNPGLASRFPTTVMFDDYNDEELVTIFSAICAAADYTATPDALAAFRARLAGTARGDTFGNARFARNCFDDAILAHAWRLRDDPSPDVSALQTLTGADVAEDGSVQ